MQFYGRDFTFRLLSVSGELLPATMNIQNP